MNTADPFVRYVTAGVTIWLMAQMIINIGMVLALLPVIGIPLPLVSYGGSALVPSLVGLGLLVGFARSEPEAAAALQDRRSSPRKRPVLPGAVSAGPRSRTPRASRSPYAGTRLMGPRRVLLAGGGTAGHTSPLLATADALRRRDPEVEVVALGTASGLEARVVPAAGYPLEVIPRVPLPRKPGLDLLRTPGRLRTRPCRGPRGARPGPARRRRRLRRLRLRAGLPRRPQAPAPARRPRGQRPARGSPTGSARGSPTTSRPASPAPTCRTPSTSACPCAG